MAQETKVMTEGSATWCLLQISIKRSGSAERAQGCLLPGGSKLLAAGQQETAPVPAIKPCFCVSSHDRGEVLASQCLQGCFQNAGQVDHAGATLGQLLSEVKTIQFKASLGHPGGSWVG